MIMEATAEFNVSLMGTTRTFKVDFDKYSFTVFSDDNSVIDGGSFGYGGRTYYTERTKQVELFYEAFEQKVVKSMKSQKIAWKEMVKYQNSK